MAKVEGIMAECDHCGYTHFCKELPSSVLDGGYTTVRNYETLPDGWKSYHEFGIGLLCPECNRIYTKLISNFKKEGRVCQ